MTKKTVSSVRETLSHFNLMPVVLVAVLVISSMVLIINFMYHLGKRLGASSQPVAVQSNASPSGVYVGAGNSVSRIDKQTHKVIANNTLYAGVYRTLYALNVKSGSAMWTLDVDSVGIPPVIVTMVAAP